MVAKRTTVSVSLTSELERYLEEKVRSGLYQTASEVMREALRMMCERDALYSKRTEEIRRDLTVGFAEMQRGESRPGDEVRKRLRLRRKAHSAPIA